ncbi:MAG: NAD-dependent epimerase/dehydratase family protein [Vicinamibacterales bacterium]
MRVLVTGGTGYLGRAVVHALAGKGHLPIVFARSASQSQLPGLAIDGDVRDPEALARAAEGCDAICHLAALVSLWRPRRADFDDINIGGLRNALAAVRRAGVPRMVYTSSFLARAPRGRTAPMAANDYQRTKVAADRIAVDALREGYPVIRLYPGVVYGPGELREGNLVGRLVHDHLSGRLPGLVGADRPWSYAWITDVAEGHVAAVEHAEVGSAYALGGVNVPQMRVFEHVRAIRGAKLPRRIPFPLARLLGAAEDARAAIFRSPPLITAGTVAIFREDWSLDSRAAIRDLGFHVRPLEEGVAALLATL